MNEKSSKQKHMNRLKILSAFFVAALLHASTFAQNYIFLSGQPLVAVSGKGEFESFSLGEYDDEQRRYVPDAQMVDAVRSLWVYDTGRTTEKVAAKIEEDYIGCVKSLVLKVEDHYQNNLLSTKPLPQCKAIPAGWGDGDYKSKGLSLLSWSLRNERVSGRWIKRLLAKAEVTEVYMAGGKSSAMVITTNETYGDKSFTAQIIANRNAAGKYVMANKYVIQGGREDQDSFAGKKQLFMHLDLDGDGNEELLFEGVHYESFETSLLHWDGREWKDVGGNGSGC